MWLKIAAGALIVFAIFAVFIVGVCVIAASNNYNVEELWRNVDEYTD